MWGCVCGSPELDLSMCSEAAPPGKMMGVAVDL